VVVVRLRSAGRRRAPGRLEVKDFSPLDEAELARQQAAAGGGDFRSRGAPDPEFCVRSAPMTHRLRAL